MSEFLNQPIQEGSPEHIRALVADQVTAIRQYLALATAAHADAVVFGLSIEGEDEMTIACAGNVDAMRVLTAGIYLAQQRMATPTEEATNA